MKSYIALLLLLIATTVSASGFPVRPMRVLVPSAVGGGNDIVARIVAKELEERLGQNVIVDNRPGASGLIAFNTLINSVPDGHTMLNMGDGQSPEFLRENGLEVIQTSARQPFTLSVNSSVPARSVREFVELAKQKPGQLHWGSNGPTSTITAGTNAFIKLTGVQLTEVPYKGGATVIFAMLSGETQLLFTGLAPMLPYVNHERIRILAVTGAKRSSLAPGIPTFREQGFAGYDYHVTFSIVMTSSAPAAAKQAIARAVSEIDESKYIKLGLTKWVSKKQ